MKLISWNVNGIRAVMNKGFMDFLNSENSDVYCIQETKIHDSDIPHELKNIGALNGYLSYWFGAKKKGYSGVAAITKVKPLSVIRGIGIEKFDDEGRVITLEFDNFYLVNCYAVNAQRGLVRLNEKIEFNTLLSSFCEELRKKKPVVICGDLNVAHKEIDLKNPKQNEKNAGFSIEERDAFQKHLDLGYIDTFRIFNQEPENYTWWSYMFNARAKNIGWRIDYFLVSQELKDKVKSAEIYDKVIGSDHCPVALDIIF